MAKPLTDSSERTVAMVRSVDTPKSAFFGLKPRTGRFVLFLAVLSLAFSKPLIELVVYAARSNLHSYILLVPIISGYLIYSRWHQLPKTYQTSAGTGSFSFLEIGRAHV